MFKIKIKIKRLNPNVKLPKIIKKGEFIDLYCSKTTTFKAPQSGTLKKKVVEGNTERLRNVTFDLQLIPLGVAIKIPKNYEAIVIPRSSTCKSMGILQANSVGLIDHSYSGNKDEWQFPALSIRNTTITEGERICQFRVQLSQKATFLQKLKWLFSSGVEIEEVEELDEVSRGGFGSTNKEF